MEADHFILCAITSPDFVDNEAEKICALFDCGFDWVHIRKPDYDATEIAHLIESIPETYRNRLRLHDHFELVERYKIGGIQLNSRCEKAPTTAVSISRSCHSVEEADKFSHLDYVTLSPIYDSISKSGYGSKFDLETLKIGTNVIALGGVTPDKFDELKRAGFRGATLLGDLGWTRPIDQFIQHIKQIKRCSNS